MPDPATCQTLLRKRAEGACDTADGGMGVDSLELPFPEVLGPLMLSHNKSW